MTERSEGATTDLGAADEPSGTWFLAGCAGLAGFFALEAALREPGQASSIAASSDDRGTTRGIVRAFGLAATLTPILRRLPGPRLPHAAAPAGLAMQAFGLSLRAWSMHTLRGSYSRTLATRGQQRVVDTGPYRLIRHPGYAGSLLAWLGFALTSSSIPAVGLVAGLLGRAYRDRITAEEILLLDELAPYAAYVHRTKKLVPFIW
jgi:protein-S-isoprenylcysteine O-methyltransferase Ste14